MQPQEIVQQAAQLQPSDESVFRWLGGMREELVGRGLTVSTPRQFSDKSAVLGYRQSVRSSDEHFILECKLQDDNGLVLRTSFLKASDQAVILSYRVALNATADDLQATLAKRLIEARRRIPIIAAYFEQARKHGTLLH